MATSDSDRARSAVFDGAQELGEALRRLEGIVRWEPLRDLILSGLVAGGLDEGADLHAAAGALAAAALDGS